MVIERTRTARRARLHPGGIHTFEVETLTQALRDEAEPYGRDGVTLVKSPHLRVVLEVLREGIALHEHREPGPVTLFLLEGEIRFEAAGEVVYLKAGEILALPTNRPHTVEAVQDSAFLLTIAPGDGRESEGCDPGEMKRVARQLRRDWPAAHERFPNEWPVEGGDEQC